MSEVLRNPAELGTPRLESPGFGPWGYLPAILPLVGALLMTLLRIQMGGERFIDDGALMMLSLACYLIAAAFLLTNLYAPFNWAERLGLWVGCAGVFFNLSSWCVRWVAAYDRELEILARNGHGEMPWVWRYIPFANLYDLSLAFAFGAGITTMFIVNHKGYRLIAAVSLTLAALILILARFIGGEFINLPPVLDSYWRPIHVGTASISYGVALVCFAVAVPYLLKDGVKPEAMAIWAGIFAVSVFATVGGWNVFTEATYTASTFLRGSRMTLPLRVDIPYVGPLLLVAGLLFAAVITLFVLYISGQQGDKARVWGQRLLRISLAVQAAAIIALVTQIKTETPLGPCPAGANFAQKCFDTAQYEKFGTFLAQQDGLSPEQIKRIEPERFVAASREFVAQRSSMLVLNLGANPVELAALITAFAATLFVILFSIKTDHLRSMLPAAEKLDSLMYKTAGVAFAGLAILLITGAIWANESWGRYWGWDSKETGAFVAWLTYGGFLHARIARGMTGRRSAYFAVVAFLLVIFTYLGVSYLLPGLHSYA